MTRYKRPNPDQHCVVNEYRITELPGMELRLEVWEAVESGERVWCMVTAPRGAPTHRNQHTPLADEHAAMLLRLVGEVGE